MNTIIIMNIPNESILTSADLKALLSVSPIASNRTAYHVNLRTYINPTMCDIVEISCYGHTSVMWYMIIAKLNDGVYSVIPVHRLDSVVLDRDHIIIKDDSRPVIMNFYDSQRLSNYDPCFVSMRVLDIKDVPRLSWSTSITPHLLATLFTHVPNLNKIEALNGLYDAYTTFMYSRSNSPNILDKCVFLPLLFFKISYDNTTSTSDIIKIIELGFFIKYTLTEEIRRTIKFIEFFGRNISTAVGIN